MNSAPLVSIICTVYNQEDYVNEALDAVLEIEYPNLELIIVDNGSTDYSGRQIKNWLEEHGGKLQVIFISRSPGMPYCKSFNMAFEQAKGDYFIDLSGDDLICKEHVQKSVAHLEKNPFAAVCFSDAFLFSKGKQLRTFYKRKVSGELQSAVSDGDIYELLVAKHHCLSVTMVIRSSAFKFEGAYDESLAYEDFDIQVRLARKYPFVFSDHIGIKKRIHSKAMSVDQYKRYKSVMLPSTLKVCQKIKTMNRTQKEDLALLNRVQFELKHALLSANFQVAGGFVELAQELGAEGLGFRLYKKWLKHHWDVSAIYSFLEQLRRN
ncbi:glycosyltransferase family 2 protein [Cecembia rubra]|uniref:glycosyltransferase family 2 protein n=1 Tax=Cecembia rubra TaxID=1485585 RepID=UPI00271555D5|nr:glycosyltransferase family 2 protein [Cecembia rubra]